jgi:hypothetical protein
MTTDTSIPCLEDLPGEEVKVVVSVDIVVVFVAARRLILARPFKAGIGDAFISRRVATVEICSRR